VILGALLHHRRFFFAVVIPSVKGEKGKTRPRAFPLADVAWQSNNKKFSKNFSTSVVRSELD
jgi:hypothetical protein